MCMLLYGRFLCLSGITNKTNKIGPHKKSNVNKQHLYDIVQVTKNIYI